MKKIIALAALMAIAPAFAAHNEFTFNVNSSGAAMYVCGVEFWNNAPDALANTMSYDLYEVNDWDGGEGTKIKSVVTHDYNLWRDEYYRFDRVGEDGLRHEIRNLKFNLSSENYGVSYSVYVCYDIPLFMDIDKVKFNTTASVTFTDNFGRNYVEAEHGNVKATIYNSIGSSDYNEDDLHYVLSNNKSTTLDNLAGGLVSASFEAIPCQASSQFYNKHVLTKYSFDEKSTARRPHVAHGGDFTLDTVVTPVAR